jgi:hypothetical protein
MVMIMPRQAGGWNLMPSGKHVMNEASDPRLADDPRITTSSKPWRPDTVNGVKTTKSKIIMKERNPMERR